MANLYASFLNQILQTPQSQPIPGRESEMTPNNAGGYGFKIDDWVRLNRFLILGSEGGTYYVGQQTLTQQNAAAVIRCIKADGIRTVELAHSINVLNKAPKTDQQLFVMALALRHGDEATKARVGDLIDSMLRTGTHVLHFASMIAATGGWSRRTRAIIADWFEYQESDKVAYQVLKYRQRDGTSMRDLLRWSHPSGMTYNHVALYQWIVGKPIENRMHLPQTVRAYDTMMNPDFNLNPVQQALFGIEQGLPREALPTEALADPEVWYALLPHTPVHALLRNLGNITSDGVLSDGAVRTIVGKLTNAETLKKARVHPFAAMLASLVYGQGHGVRGNKTWTPVRSIIEALDDAYEFAFENVEPTGKRILVAVDVSGSMGQRPCEGTPIKPVQAAAAMALTLARTEPNATVVEFHTEVDKVVPITKRTALSSLMSRARGGTDLSAPIYWANKTRMVFDAFIILTDNETWAGHYHPQQALEHYRRNINPQTKLVCCSMASNHVEVVDPNDPLSLGCAGLDSSLPSIVADFIGD